MSRESNIKPVKDLIFKRSRLHSMAKISQDYASIDHKVMAALPSMLSDNCQTRSYVNHILTITTYSNAVATQLRYNANSILAKLKQQLIFNDISSIKIKVIAKPKEQTVQTQAHQFAQVSKSNCSMLKDTADAMGSDSLAGSLRKLANTLENYSKD